MATFTPTSGKLLSADGPLLTSEGEAFVEMMLQRADLGSDLSALHSIASKFSIVVAKSNPVAATVNLLSNMAETSEFIDAGVDDKLAEDWARIIDKISKLTSEITRLEEFLADDMRKVAAEITPKVEITETPEALLSDARAIDKNIAGKLDAMTKFMTVEKFTASGLMESVFNSINASAKLLNSGKVAPRKSDKERATRVNFGVVSYRFITETEETTEYSEWLTADGASEINVKLWPGAASQLRQMFGEEFDTEITRTLKRTKRGESVPTIVETVFTPTTFKKQSKNVVSDEIVDSIQGELI